MWPLYQRYHKELRYQEKEKVRPSLRHFQVRIVCSRRTGHHETLLIDRSWYAHSQVSPKDKTDMESHICESWSSALSYSTSRSLHYHDMLVMAGTYRFALPKLSWRAVTLTGLFLFWYVLTDLHYEVVGWLSLREVMRRALASFPIASLVLTDSFCSSWLGYVL